MIIVASCPHTGSHFAVNTIGLPLRNWDRGGVSAQNLYHVYSGESLEIIKRGAREGATLVVPMRHPMAVAQSWANRGKPIAEHPVHEPMIKLFRNLIEHVVPLNPLYLPVDVPNRDKYLRALSDVVGRELKTDWAPASHHEIAPAKLFDDDIAAVHELLRDPFFEEFKYA